MTNGNEVTNQQSEAPKAKSGCLGIFIGGFIVLWAIVFIGLGVNFIVQMNTAMKIKNECLNNGNCPTLQVQPDGKGGTVIRPTFPTTDPAK